ncbi:MAG: RsmB/NOP family class I SAM-dependent RNA methyltransferase [Treponema sp.]|nr:RsmB/NOP family class I SAM-dependent RNA methyltransferase [Treponema sp.]
MHRSERTEKLSGGDGFEKYYSALYGERWSGLKAALLEEPAYTAWNAGGMESYFMDAASVRAAVSLPLTGAERVLDLCAAPGGKTLVLASLMSESAYLSSNERSPERKNRLLRVCDSCLPENIRTRVTVTCSDGAKWCTTRSDCFDAILLDAPCSSERHVLSDPKYLSQWTPSRIKTVAMEQWALVSSAYRMLVPGGFLLYSTCALCPSENDEIIARLINKFDTAVPDLEGILPAYDRNKVRLFCNTSLPGAEKTSYGWLILPDTQTHAGPIYFSLIRKQI